MAQRPIPLVAVAHVKGPALPLWFTFDPNEDEKELWHLEQELASEVRKIQYKDTFNSLRHEHNLLSVGAN